MPDQRLGSILDGAIPFALRLRQRFRGIDVREGVLIKGPSGWGEFAPFDDYSDAAASRWLDSAIEAAFGDWPTPLREEVEVNAIIPAVSSDVAARMARDAVAQTGCRTLKVKVGAGVLADDEARVAAVRDVMDAILGPGRGALRIDANGGWSEASAITALRRLGSYGVEYVEQPCAGIEELIGLRRRTDVPIAVDETLRQDPSRVRVREFADIAIVKGAPLGGVRAALAVVDSLDVPVVVSGSLDSSVGLAVSLALAAAVEDLPFACGLGTGALLADDVVEHTSIPSAGVLTVSRPAPSLDDLLAARDRMEDSRADWWRDRVRRAWLAGSAERFDRLVGRT